MSGCVRESFRGGNVVVVDIPVARGLLKGSTEVRRPALSMFRACEKEKRDEKNDGEVGLPTGLEMVESVGDELKVGTVVSCGGLLPETDTQLCRGRRKGIVKLGRR